MIPLANITAWRAQAPWVDNAQVEQDLIISRALVEIFSLPFLSERLAFRGGTAFNKLHIDQPARYSEDIDLVQIKGEPIGPLVRSLKSVLDPWLGESKTKQGQMIYTIAYRVESEDSPPLPLRLKIEINTREHDPIFGLVKMPYAVSSPWYSGKADITTYTLDELMGTKLRALYQRRKGRDVFDLALALQQTEINPERVIEAFNYYLKQVGNTITRDQFDKNLAQKLDNSSFTADISPLLTGGHSSDIHQDAKFVSSKLIDLLA